MAEQSPPASTPAEWQRLLDEWFPDGVRTVQPGSKVPLDPSTSRNWPVVVVSGMDGSWPVLLGMPEEAPYGLATAELFPVSWEPVDHPLAVSVWVRQAGDRPTLGLGPVTPQLAEQMADRRDQQRVELLSRIEATAPEIYEQLTTDQPSEAG